MFSELKDCSNGGKCREWHIWNRYTLHPEPGSPVSQRTGSDGNHPLLDQQQKRSSNKALDKRIAARGK